MIEKSITHDHATLYYSLEGKGLSLVFVHGFCEDHTVWNEFVKPFTENYRVILSDTPGFGKSFLQDITQGGRDTMHRVPTSNHMVSMDFYADCVKAILNEEKITECLMIGHSMGGYITMNFASRFPKYLKGFALFHSTTLPDDDAKKKDRIHVAEFMSTDPEHHVKILIHELYEKLFGSSYTANHHPVIEEIIKHAIEISPANGIIAASLAMKDRRDTTDTLKHAKVPVLFILGKEDNVIEFEKAMPLTHLPDRSVICVLDHVSHMGMIETPDKCRMAIEEWISLLSEF